jgi:ubiquinol-cytochrome c reductase cytochrome b subunit
MASEVPLVGGLLKRFMRGGNEMGTLTLSRFFVAHVFILPALILAYIAVHVYLFRKAGAAGPPSEDPIRPKLPSERFYPRQVMMDAAMSLLVIIVLGALAHWLPTELGPKANPADTQYVPRPEWYYLPVFQWLKYFKGSLAIFGIVIIPSLTAALVLFLPFYDRGLERRPWKRPIAVGIYTVIMGTLIFFGWLSGYEDRKDPAIAKQVVRQREETEEFMREPFAPEPAAGSLSAVSAIVLDPVAAAGKKVYESEACDSCHGENGVGSSNGPKLVGKTAQKSPEELTNLLRHPTPKMLEGEMQPVTIPDEDLQSLVAYLKSLK